MTPPSLSKQTHSKKKGYCNEEKRASLRTLGSPISAFTFPEGSPILHVRVRERRKHEKRKNCRRENVLVYAGSPTLVLRRRARWHPTAAEVREQQNTKMLTPHPFCQKCCGVTFEPKGKENPQKKGEKKDCCSPSSLHHSCERDSCWEFLRNVVDNKLNVIHSLFCKGLHERGVLALSLPHTHGACDQREKQRRGGEGKVTHDLLQRETEQKMAQ